MSIPVSAYVVLGSVIFAIGGLGLLVRRSPLVMLMCAEMMWTAVILMLVAFSRLHLSMDGHVFSFLIITVAAAEVAIGLALIVLLFRQREAADVDEVRELNG